METLMETLMETNRRGTLLILSYEQLRLRPYKDAVGKLTVGWGHLILASEMATLDRELTRAEANELFLQDLEEKEAGVAHLVSGVKLTSNQFSALVCFAFNVGVGALAGSTMLKLIRSGDLLGVPAQFGRWTKGTVGGVKKELRGLVERRAAEAALWSLVD